MKPISPSTARVIADAFGSCIRSKDPFVSVVADKDRTFEVRSEFIDGRRIVSLVIHDECPICKWTALDLRGLTDVHVESEYRLGTDTEKAMRVLRVRAAAACMSIRVEDDTPRRKVVCDKRYPPVCRPPSEPDDYPERM